MTEKLSASIKTDDLATVSCLRALAFYSESTAKNRAVAGMTDRRWEQEGHVATFYFSDAESRDKFFWEVDRLLHLTPHAPEGAVVVETKVA